MKFSYYLPCYIPNDNKSATDLFDEALYQAQYAEDLGFQEIVIPEHYFMNFIGCPSILMFAVKVAQVTKLRIASAVIPLPLYHPLRLAQEIAFADVLTEGRLDIGIGRGAFHHEFDRLQVPMERNREVFEEVLDVLIKAWTCEDFSYEGKFFQFPETTVLPRPVQKPYPPIWMAGQSHYSLEWAIRHGFHIMFTPLLNPIDSLQENFEIYEEVLEEVGKTQEEVQFMTLRNLFVTESEDAVLKGVQYMGHNQDQYQAVKSGPSTVRKGFIQTAESKFSLEEIRQNVVIGDVETCIEKIEAYRDIGVNHLCTNMAFGHEHKEVLHSMKLFSHHVMPHFR